MERLASASPRRPPAALRAAWVLTVVALAVFAAAAVIWRGHVTRVWPASAWVLGAGDRGQPARP